jgi:hypothetical protein
MRAQLASQSAYNAAAFADFTQDTNSVELVATAGYTSGAPATWTMDIPDLAGAGYDAAWGLRSGMSTHWEVGAVGGNLLPFIGAAPFDGAQMIGAAASSAPSAFMKLIQARRGRLP